jgi:hypothetical protein
MAMAKQNALVFMCASEHLTEEAELIVGSVSAMAVRWDIPSRRAV